MFTARFTRLQRLAAKRNAVRFVSSIQDAFAAAVPKLQEEAMSVRKEFGDVQIGTCTVEQAYAGMRSVKCMVTETSVLDAEEGIRFRGYTIPECQKILPAAKAGGEPLPEGLFWLLLTGQVPSEAEVKGLSDEFAKRGAIPDWVKNLILSFPADLHPMTQFSMAIMALQKDSKFAQAYHDGVHKREYWKYCLEDTLDCVAKCTGVAALVFRNSYFNGDVIAPDNNLDWSANFSHQLGFDDPMVYELMRLYLTIHTDHEGGNVSAHTTHLVGSALSDPYLSLSAGMNGLAGPLHGLANQEVLRWLRQFNEKYGAKGFTVDTLKEALWDTLNSGQVVPGYGHAVLRKTDPRFACQNEFARKHIKDDIMVELVNMLYEAAPVVLTEHGKTKNPWPNVDAHSGVLLQHYGITQEDYYTVMFGVSRAMGVLASLCIDRALGLPIERPKSLSTDALRSMLEKK